MKNSGAKDRAENGVGKMGVARLDQVTKDFGAVRGLGDVTVLLGASGSGKSTLLRHLNGLHRPSGDICEVIDAEACHAL